MISRDEAESKVPGYFHGPASKDVWSHYVWGALTALVLADGAQLAPYDKSPRDLREVHDEDQARFAIRRALQAKPGHRLAAAISSIQDTNRMAGRVPVLPAKEK